MGEVYETVAGNEKEETRTVIPSTLIENQKLNTGQSLFTRDAQKGNRNAEGGA